MKTTNLENKIDALYNVIKSNYDCDIERNDIVDNDNNIFSTSTMEFYVYDDVEADRAFKQNVLDIIDDIGIKDAVCLDLTQPCFLNDIVLTDLIKEDLESCFRQDINDLFEFCKDNEILDDDIFEKMKFMIIENVDKDDYDNYLEYDECISEIKDYDYDQVVEEFLYNFDSNTLKKVFDPDDYMDEAIKIKLDYIDIYNYFEDFFDNKNELLDFYDKHHAININNVIDIIKDVDGRGNSLASYDGVENECFVENKFYFIYKIG